MSNIPKISVIVPVYRVEKYLARCIDSVLNQSEQDFELILIDDGSDDACPNICDEYAEKYPQITVIHQENHGTAYSRNIGLDVAKGEFIAFIDPDDWIHVNYLEVLISNMENHDLSCCEYIKVSEFEKDVQNQQVDSIETCSLKDALQRDDCRVYIWGKIYRKRLINQHRFNPTLMYTEDRLFNAELFANNIKSKCIVVHNKLYYYFQNENGITNDSNFSDLPAINYMVSVAEKTRCESLLIYLIDWLYIKRQNGFHIGNPPDYDTVELLLNRCYKLSRNLDLKFATKIVYTFKIRMPHIYSFGVRFKRNIARIRNALYKIL